MNPDFIFTNFNGFILVGLKYFFLACTVFYFIFAIILIRQVTTMTKNITDKFNYIPISLSYIHLMFSAFLILSTLAL